MLRTQFCAMRARCCVLVLVVLVCVVMVRCVHPRQHIKEKDEGESREQVILNHLNSTHSAAHLTCLNIYTTCRNDVSFVECLSHNTEKSALNTCQHLYQQCIVANTPEGTNCPHVNKKHNK